MPTSPSLLSDVAIQQINSLGGPPLPMGVSPEQLKVIMENVSASQSPFNSCKAALTLVSRMVVKHA
jgi:hypothetical protein